MGGGRRGWDEKVGKAGWVGGGSGWEEVVEVEARR